ncbi:MAG: hypothetical protein QG585_356 [Patescibacteria group bacterium]|jgi:hypothetical protein|nr:hypothetical protein [Patescibacteria group bacterium]
MPFDNLLDIKRLVGGTLSFTWEGIACVGVIDEIDYVPLGPGAVNAQLSDVKEVASGISVVERFYFSVSCFFAEVTDRPREMIIASVIPELEDSIAIYSFRCRD